jgi:hypothetical protein
MSSQNGVQELFYQKIELVFQSINEELTREEWNIVKDQNIHPVEYDFIQGQMLTKPCECKNLDELRNKFQKTICSKLGNSGLSLIELVNHTGVDILNLEEQKKLLNNAGLITFYECLRLKKD